MEKDINNFIKLAKSNLSYHAVNKSKFHRLGKKIAKELAQLMNVDADIRSNMGGIAVSGEITLHSDNIYVQFSQNALETCFMYRSCKSKKDYCGGPNNWMQWDRLLDLEQVAKIILRNTNANK